MALGRKKEEKLEQAIEAAAAALPAPAPAPEPEEEEDDTSLALLAPEPEAAADAPPEAAGGNDGALLSMFQGSELEVADLSTIVDLAGNVEIDDLLEELQTVAAALGITAGAAALEAAA